HERIDAANLLAHLVTVHVRQHQIEQDRMRALLAGQLDPLAPRARGQHAKPLELERVLETEHDMRLVLDHENRAFRLHPRLPSLRSWAAVKAAARWAPRTPRREPGGARRQGQA